MNSPFQITGTYKWKNPLWTPENQKYDASFVNPTITITCVALDDQLDTAIDILVVDDNDSIAYIIKSTEQPESRSDSVVKLWVEVWLETNKKI